MAWFQDCSLAQSITVSQQHYSLSVLFAQPFYVVSCCRSAVSSAPSPYWKKAAGHRLSETGILTKCKTRDFDVFLPLLLYSPLRSLLANAVEPKPQIAKALNLYRTARKRKAFPQSGSFWCQLLCFSTKPFHLPTPSLSTTEAKDQQLPTSPLEPF